VPALDAAGIDHGTIYTLRHTAITNWLAAGLTVFEVSRYAGTSVPMIDQHYGHLAIGHEDAARAKLNARLGAQQASNPSTTMRGTSAIPLPD
jgi:integrase